MCVFVRAFDVRRPVQVSTFRQLAISDGGLMHDKHRRYIWRLLACDIRQFALDEQRVGGCVSAMGSSNSDMSDSCSVADSTVYDPPSSDAPADMFNIEALQAHPEWRQVEMDVQVGGVAASTQFVCSVHLRVFRPIWTTSNVLNFRLCSRH
jgi:hypothetical protein